MDKETVTDTRSVLMDTATALFLNQGVAKTTIQQLADAAGISKGAFYLHFRSKTQLLLAIMESLGDDILEGVRKIRDREDLEPREKLRLQLRYQFDDVLENQRLMELYLKDSGIAIDEEILLLAQKMRLEWQLVQEEFLVMVFPDHHAKYTADLAVMINGALNEYYTMILLDEASLDADRVADFLFAMVEAMARRLESEDLSPVLDFGTLQGASDLEAKLAQASRRRIDTALDGMLAAADEMTSDDGNEVRETISLLRSEISGEAPNRIVLQGLLANLRDFKALQPQRRDLAHELSLKLI